MVAYARNYILLICLLLLGACRATGTLTHEDVHRALKEGMTTEDVISFFEGNGIGYAFRSREIKGSVTNAYHSHS